MEAGPIGSDSSRYQETLDYLFQRINYERTTDIPYRSRGFKLGRMQELMDALGNPERRLKTIHVAGTKGKGSTSAFLANILWHGGYQVGKFTSPHLECLEERFWLNGENCTQDDIVQLIDTIRPIVDRMDETATPDDRPTFFEITTAMGFLLFAERNVDFAVMEVGLGGRLDSTNVCHPIVCLITSISRDHTALLGDTLAEIAGEKAGIIKPHIPVISGVGAAEAKRVIQTIASENNSPLFELGIDFQSQSLPATQDALPTANAFQQSLEFRWESESSSRYTIKAKGKHQVANAGLAIATVQLLRDKGFPVSKQAVESGLASTNLPARIECLSERPAIIVDAAHNDASAEALANVLEEHFPGRKRNLVYASSGDKDHAAVLKLLLGACDQAWFTKYGFSPRTTDPAYLRDLAGSLKVSDAVSLHVANESKDAFHQAFDVTGPDDVLVVTGSFFIAAEFKRFWITVQAGENPSISSAAP